MAAGALLSFLAGRDDSGLLGGSLYKAAAFRFGDSAYITVTRTARGESAYRGPLRLTAYLDGRSAVTGDFAAGDASKEEYRLTAPSPDTVRRLSVRIEAGGLTLDLTAPIR